MLEIGQINKSVYNRDPDYSSYHWFSVRASEGFCKYPLNDFPSELKFTFHLLLSSNYVSRSRLWSCHFIRNVMNNKWCCNWKCTFIDNQNVSTSIVYLANGDIIFLKYIFKIICISLWLDEHIKGKNMLFIYSWVN